MKVEWNLKERRWCDFDSKKLEIEFVHVLFIVFVQKVFEMDFVALIFSRSLYSSFGLCDSMQELFPVEAHVSN